MSEPILILGQSGSGKSYACRNLDPSTTLLVSVDGKRYPFSMKGWGRFSSENLEGSVYNPPKDKSYSCLRKAVEVAVENGKKTIVIDDSQYLLCNEFFARTFENGYNKFTEIAFKFHDLIEWSRNLPDDVVVYFLHHLEHDGERIKVKTVGKMIDEKTNIEGKFTVCLQAQKADGEYKLLCSVDDQSIIKAPPEMFDATVMDNDLAAVDSQIRDFWGI